MVLVQTGEAHESERHQSGRYHGDRNAAERRGHVGTINPFANGGEKNQHQRKADGIGGAEEQRFDKIVPVGNVQQRHAQHRAIGRNQRQINTQDAVEQRTGFLDHHFRQLDNRGDGDDERDRAQIAQVEGRQEPAVDDIACTGGHRQHEGGCHAHAQRRFEFLRHAHKRAQAENPHQHNVVDENGANDEEYIMGHGLHCCGKGWEIVARGTIPGKTSARFQRLRLSQFVRSPSTLQRRGILTAGGKPHIAAGRERQCAAGLRTAAVDKQGFFGGKD